MDLRPFAAVRAPAPAGSARPGIPLGPSRAGHTPDFNDQVAWLAVHVSKAPRGGAVADHERTVGAIVTRVSADIDAIVDRLKGLRPYVGFPPPRSTSGPTPQPQRGGAW